MPFAGGATEVRFESVGVVGAGNIGIGVVTDLVMHGINAIAVDISESQLEIAREEVLQNVHVAPLVSKTLPRVSKDEAAKRMVFSTDLGAVAGCNFIIENVTEDWSIKKPVYEKLDRIVPPEICFGANTSCISITQIAGATRRPENVIGVHFMNPVHLKPTVEVIRGLRTSDCAVDTLQELTTALKKETIIVEDFPGFVSNRISHVFMNEAAFTL